MGFAFRVVVGASEAAVLAAAEPGGWSLVSEILPYTEIGTLKGANHQIDSPLRSASAGYVALARKAV